MQRSCAATTDDVEMLQPGEHVAALSFVVSSLMRRRRSLTLSALRSVLVADVAFVQLEQRLVRRSACPVR